MPIEFNVELDGIRHFLYDRFPVYELFWIQFYFLYFRNFIYEKLDGHFG